MLWTGEKQSDADNDWIRKLAARRKVAVPDVAAEKAGEAPEIPPQHMTWFNAYMELATCRTERGLIAWTDIARYSEVYTLPLETLRRIIRRIDAAVQADNDRKNKTIIKKPR